MECEVQQGSCKVHVYLKESLLFENVLENDWVRVLKVTERNGETAPLHSHPLENLLVASRQHSLLNSVIEPPFQLNSLFVFEIKITIG